MRTVPADLAAKIVSGDFTGPNKATTRVTIQRVQLGIYPAGTEVYSSIHFLNSSEAPVELPNLKSCKWSRTADGDAGSTTLELFNTKPLPAGSLPDVGDSFDLLGYYTYNRGVSSYSQSTWGHSANEWQSFLVPDRVLRVYQGYGGNYNLLPENDPDLLLMGVFLIDDVTYSADGLITVEGRDVGRLLIDQIMFPPVVPLLHYPLKFEKEAPAASVLVPSTAATWVRPTYEGSSNGQIGSDTEIQFGHHPQDAFDTSTDPSTGTYWLSRGHSAPRNPDSFEWIQGALPGTEVMSNVKFSVRGGPYRALLSVWTDTAKGGAKTGWLGDLNIPYTAGNTIENGSKIPYMVSIVAKFGSTDNIINFPAITGATKVRLTFTQLYDSKHQPLPYRAAVRDVQVTQGPVVLEPAPETTTGDYNDYSEIVKLLLAYGGFFWPQANGGAPDAYLENAGRVWGDIQMSGTVGEAPLGIEVWDKKPLLDGINYVKDVLGFIFFVDETGGAIFRSPNTFKLGNWQTDASDLNAARVVSHVSIYDDQAILGLRAKLSSRNLREHVFVANVDGQSGAVSPGRIPYPSSFRRVAGWTDQNFQTAAECQVMADLITLRQLFTFRQNSVRIAANPAIQVDDQVQIFERTTGDAYYHYVHSISSDWEATSGKWTYDLTTSWLGEDPAGEWAVDTSTLSPETQAFLTALGQI